ncbi:hypothetical protein WR25_26092 [Diploscapter pachys]|uniref:Protein S-acyltransferase n=1 Tax=Diploscapter pachys TaxID=2018661 RepID=A0A2A2J620_9BILA|nr:hypothetical protein WR25_26092 [Diploscapter pachys]
MYILIVSSLQLLNSHSPWLLLAASVPLALNVASVVLIGITIWHLVLVKQNCHKISQSSYWLARTAIRVGLGPTTRKLLVDFAANKPEYVKLVQGTK